MEVTKYYCEVCRSEVGNGQWNRAELAITFRSKDGSCPDKIYSMKKICDKCTEDLGFPTTPEYSILRNLEYKLSMTDKFMAVFKKILSWKEKDNATR